MEQFRQGFIDEALQLLEDLEELILEIEDRTSGADDVQEIFRVMHTIKGSSAMFHFTNTELIAHQLEDVYDKIRSGELEYNSEINDLTVLTVDLLRNLLNSNDKIDDSIQERISEFSSIITKYAVENNNRIQNAENIKITESKVNDTEAYYYIYYNPDSDVLQRGIAPLGVFEELTGIGQITGIPYLGDIPLIEDYNPADFYLSWDVFLKTTLPIDDIEDIFMFYLDNEFKVFEIKPEQIDNNHEFLKYCLAINKSDFSINQIKEKLHNDFAIDFEDDSIENQTEIKENEIENKSDSGHIESIKVESKKLDELINLVSELVTLNSRLQIQTKDIDNENLQKTIKSVTKLSKRFRDNALELRLIPVKVLILKLQRLVRDLSKTLNKEIQFIAEGTNTELDKNIISRLEAPLMHILRNSIDHGIELPEDRLKANKPEKGLIRFIAFYSGSHVFIQIQDDGGGIDIDKVKKKAIEKGLIENSTSFSKKDIFNLLFSSGFSTAGHITNVSGRGVGLDVVRKELSEMRGEIDIESEKGLGTSITLKLPLTLSIIDTLMVKVCNTYLLIPKEFVVQTKIYRYNKHTNKSNVEFGDKILSVISLRDDFKTTSEMPEKQLDIIIQIYDKNYVIRVDKVIGEHQAVVKPLGHYNQNHDYFSGASILGDGTLAFILDVNKVINLKKSNSRLGNYNLK